jgi:hypothetical protein
MARPALDTSAHQALAPRKTGDRKPEIGNVGADFLQRQTSPGFPFQFPFPVARPAWVQRIMWDIVKATPCQPYVADPAKGSIHNFGCAVDLTVATREGKPLDMGSRYDIP